MIAGTLEVQMMANMARLSDDMRKAQGVVGGAMQGIERMVSSAKNALIGLGAGLTVAAFSRMVKGAIDSADEVSKLSQKIGVATEELSAYQVAAQLSDVSNEQLATGFKQLAKNQSDYVAGIGEAKDAFAALGVTTDQVKALNGDTAKIFDLVAGKLGQYEDGANKTAIAMKIFGKSGAELIPLINSLDEAKKEAAALGYVITKETAAAAERFNDNLTRGGISLKAYALGMAEGLLPTLEAFSVRMANAARDTEAMDKAARIAGTGMKLLATGATIVSTMFSLLGDRLGALAAAAVSVASGEFKQAWLILQDTSRRGVEGVAKAIDSLNKTWSETAGRVAAAAPELGKNLAAPAIVSAQQIAKANAEAKKEMEKYLKFAKLLADDEERRRQDQGESNQAETDRMKAMEARGEAIRDQLDPTRELLRQQQEAQRLADEGYITQEEANRVYENTQLKIYALTLEQMGFNSKLKEGKTFAEEFGHAISSSLEESIARGDKFNDVLRNMGQYILKIVAHRMISEPIGNAVKGTLDNLDWGKILSFGGGKAVGGPVSGGMSYLVGEKGPEIFTPQSSGSITPNSKIGGSVYNIDARGADKSGLARLEAMILQLNGSIEHRAVAANLAFSGRGG